MKGRYENVDGHPVFTPSEDAPGRPLTDQVGVRVALPDTLAEFLRLPDVHVRPDEAACEVVIAMPAYLGAALAERHPNPLQVRLAVALIDAAEQDLETHRRDLQEKP